MKKPLKNSVAITSHNQINLSILVATQISLGIG